jgi:hypothetical protein
MLLVISLALMLGSWGSGVWAWYLWYTRAYRRNRNMLVIRSGPFVVGISSLGALLVILNSLERMGVGRHTPQDEAALGVFTASYACVTALAIWREFKWRRSNAPDETKSISPPDN